MIRTTPQTLTDVFANFGLMVAWVIGALGVARAIGGWHE